MPAHAHAGVPLALALVLAAGEPSAQVVGPASARTEPAAMRGSEPVGALRAKAVELAYNLDYEPALKLLRNAVKAAPDDAALHNSLATVLWLHLLFQRGAVTVDHYMGSFSRARVDLEAPPAAIDAEFRRHAERGRDLAERRLDAAPRDVQAAYNLGVALGLLASYTATVEGRMMAGFRAARRSFDLHERVLDQAPDRVEAGMIVGMYRYIVSTLSLPLRAMAYLVGFGGGRDEGIALLKAAADSRTDAKPDAMFALVLIYNRENRFDEALALLRELRALYPRNRLVVLEAGATALRAGRAQDADALLSEGIASMTSDTRPRIPGERSLWHYQRGAARARLGRHADAEADLRIGAAPDAQAWVGGRAELELGRLALGRGDREAARARATAAQQLCRRGNDSECVGEARRLQRSAHGR